MSDASMSGGVVPGCPVELDKVSWREAARCLRELTQLKRGKHITKETSLRGNNKTDRLPKGKYATPAGVRISYRAGKVATYVLSRQTAIGSDNTLGCYRECSGESAPRWVHTRP